nr:retrovirus-related Pol polyprotein from transposon TNT 1-94 [Tanacetum cinerariifolium]
MLLMQAQENGVAFDEEWLLFLVGGQDNAIDEDVDEQPVQDLSLNVDNRFQANDCDTFDSNVNEAPTAQTMFMANLSSTNLVYDEAGPSYDLDILYEEQVELYERRARFELTETEQKIDEQLRIFITDRNFKEETLKRNFILRKMNDKRKDAECMKHKVKIAPHDYSKENFLETFTPQNQLTPEQIFWSQDLIKMKAKALKEQITTSRPIKALMVYPPNIPKPLVLRVLPTKSQVKNNFFTLIQLFLEFDKTCKKRITPTGLTEGEKVLNKPRNVISRRLKKTKKRTKSDQNRTKNEKRGEAKKSLKQLQLKEEEKPKKTKKEWPKTHTRIKSYATFNERRKERAKNATLPKLNHKGQFCLPPKVVVHRDELCNMRYNNGGLNLLKPKTFIPTRTNHKLVEQKGGREAGDQILAPLPGRLLAICWRVVPTNYDPKGERFLIASRFPTPPLACAFFSPGATVTRVVPTNYDPKGEMFLIASRFPTLPLACAFFSPGATVIGPYENFQCQPVNYCEANPSYGSYYPGCDQFGDFRPQQYLCCENCAHTGYNCPPKVSVISNPEPCNQTTIDELPQALPIFHPTFHSEAESPFTLDSTPTYVDESPNIFNPPPQHPIYSCEFCGSNAQYGHYCTPQAQFNNPEQGYSPDFNFPQNIHNFQ